MNWDSFELREVRLRDGVVDLSDEFGAQEAAPLKSTIRFGRERTDRTDEWHCLAIWKEKQAAEVILCGSIM